MMSSRGFRFLFPLVAMVAALSATSFAQASGSKAGNGGHGVRCSGGRLELLDLYEAREFYGIPFSGNMFNTTEQELDRLQQDLALVLGADHPFLTVFLDARRLLNSVELQLGPLAPTPDAGFIYGHLPANCQVEQLAVRSMYATQFVYVTVSKPDFNMMLSTERALLMLHEAAHERFEWATLGSTVGSTPSTFAIRQLVAMMSGPIDYKIKKAGVIRTLIQTQSPASFDSVRP